MTRDDAAKAHWQALSEGDLAQFVVYNSPADYPGKYVVRMWRVGAKMGLTKVVESFDTLKQARTFVPEGLFRLPRQPGDDPVIVEIWF